MGLVHRSRRGSTRGGARRCARATRRDPRRRYVGVPLPRGVRAGGELEDLVRELPRVLPLRRCAPGFQRRGRRFTGRVPARGARSCVQSGRPTSPERQLVPRGRRGAAQPVSLPLAEFRPERLPGHPNLSCGPMLPIDPERTARFLDYFFFAPASIRPGSTSCWRRQPGGLRTEASWRGAARRARES